VIFIHFLVIIINENAGSIHEGRFALFERGFSGRLVFGKVLGWLGVPRFVGAGVAWQLLSI